MEIYFKQKRPQNNSMKKALVFFMQYLLPKNKNYSVVIEYFTQEKEDKSGLYSKGELSESDSNSNEYLIKINEEQHLQAQLKTLAHETVHLYQFLKNKNCDWSVIRNPRNAFEKYLLDPNELQAIAYTDILYTLFIQNNKNIKEKEIYNDLDFK